MKINCYISTECTSEEPLTNNLLHALAMEEIEAEIHFHRISEKEAAGLELTGSPSLFIDGVHVLKGDSAGFS